MKSVMSHQFSQVPTADIQRSSFNRNHGYKTTFDAGYLIPIYVDEALPGDTHVLNLTAFARLATPIVPIMDNMRMQFHFFSVPIRLVWDNFQKFMGEQANPTDSISFLVPQMPINNVLVGTLSDYLGLPTGIATNINVNSLWHRAYNLIWNEWYRDQNLQNSVVVDKDDGPDTYSDYVVLRRGKRHDYFTSALPWPQKGGVAIQLPLGSTAPILWQAQDPLLPSGTTGVYARNSTTGVMVADEDVYIRTSGLGNARINRSVTGSDANAFTIDPNNSLYTDLSTASAATINSIREAFQLQRMLERDARGGTRYTEIIKSHFGVTSPDSRLQRPEYLGGGTVAININPVQQTSSSDVTTPQGNLAGFGTASGSGIGFTQSFTEHCILLGLVSVSADLTYQQGIDRMFLRRTKYDYFWPTLAHLGEQTITNTEIYTTTNTTQNAGIFGYQERYAEYRYKPSKITGQFRSTFATTLDIWHLSQEFAALPVLNASFIQDDPPIDRIIAVPSEPHFLYDSYIQLRSVRPMPIYSVPGLIDHF